MAGTSPASAFVIEVMTRLPVCALLGAVVAAALMAGCGSGGGSTPTTNATTGGTTSTKAATLGDRGGQKLPLRRCSPGKLADRAGHDVQVSGAPCWQVGVPPITGLYVASEHNPALFLEKSGWTCWQRLIENGATTDNVCWRGYEVVVFQFSG
jgi:hypothetical protein